MFANYSPLILMIWSQGNFTSWLLIKIRDLESFAEKGVSDKRQKLRYEHYEEKR